MRYDAKAYHDLFHGDENPVVNHAANNGHIEKPGKTKKPETSKEETPEEEPLEEEEETPEEETLEEEEEEKESEVE
jgi:hypothetical protein